MSNLILDHPDNSPNIMLKLLALELELCWKIENFSFQKGRLLSPRFYFMAADWCVEILLPDMCVSENQIKIAFHQLTNQEVQVNWSCALLNSKSPLLNLSEQKFLVNNGKSCGACCWIFKCDKFNTINLPNDILTVVCRIWIDDVTHYFLNVTKFELTAMLPQTDLEQFGVVIKKNFLWTKDVFNITVGQTEKLKQTILKDKVLTIKLFKETRQRLKIIVEMPPCTVLKKYKILYFSVDYKMYMPCTEDKFTDNSRYIFYINNIDVLPRFATFLFTFVYYSNSIEKTASNSIQNVRPNRNSDINSNESLSKQLNRFIHGPQSPQPPQMNSPNTIFQDLRSMYEEGILSDFSLRVQDRAFRVHKNILSARSSVFKAMFTTDMKEKGSDHVVIPDVDVDTIQRMLKFIYWDNVDENLQRESACSLYSIADKYALEPLKQRCGIQLMTHLSATNVLDILLLSDAHQDKVLKAVALDFISKNDKEIIGKEQWSKFKEEHGPLTLEILEILYLKKMVV